MEVIEKTITCYPGQIFHIYPLGDIHLGSIHCSEESIQAQVNKILSEKNSLVIGMGDYCDCILKNDPRFDIEGLAPWVKKGNIIESQRRRVRQLLSPLAKKGKILGLLTGNHEETIHSHYQEDMTKNICDDIGVSYGGYHCFFVLNFTWRKSVNQFQVIIHAWHGAGASQTEGARVMRLMRLVNDIQADIYLMGHLHAVTQYSPDRLTYQRGRIKSTRLLATMTGSWLKTYTQGITTSYGEMKGYKPSRIGCPVIDIEPETKEFTVRA